MMADEILFRPEVIHVYGEPSEKRLDVEGIAAWLRERVGAEVCAHDDLLSAADPSSCAPAIARLRVRNIYQPFEPAEPLPMEIEFERKNLASPSDRTTGILYDGFGFAEVCGSIISEEARGPRHAHVVFTKQYLGTFDENDRRYHARTIICSWPVVVSTTGLREAPAKPREYYLLREGYAAAGKREQGEIELAGQFADRMLLKDDERLTNVARGYVLQALSYVTTGEPFCDEPSCRLFNAHWQEEMLAAQSGGTLCGRHEQWLRGL
jgi:hypothetical protein